jgi:hypothetical protein
MWLSFVKAQAAYCVISLPDLQTMYIKTHNTVQMVEKIAAVAAIMAAC